MGTALLEQGHADRALDYLGKAARLQPDRAEMHFLVGSALARLGRLAGAEVSFRRALSLRPDFAPARSHLGTVRQMMGRPDDAAASFREAIRLDPDYGEAHWKLALLLHDQRKWDEAAASYQQALRVRPNFADGHKNLANVLRSQKRFDEAIGHYREALRLRPDFAQAFVGLGAALFEQGHFAAAVSAYRRGLQHQPDDSAAQVGLGFALHHQGHLSEAIACYRRALELRPDNFDAHLNLGIALPLRVEHEQALAHLREALRLAPDSALIWNSYLHTLHYCPGVSLAELHRGHQKFATLHAAPLRSEWQPHDNDRDPNRPLRLGFVSPHFGQHPVGYFLMGMLEHLDAGEAEIFCYSDRKETQEDSVTTRFRAVARRWQNVTNENDQELARRIRADRIDILFDLAGHTGGNRLLCFARKPAPVQITWADYVGTTGMAAIDYILADRYEIPPEAEQWYVEKVLRMPDDYICYDPPPDAPPVGPLPALSRGAVTFGSFSVPNKITEPTLSAWARILHRVPNSELFLKYRWLDEAGTADRLRRIFAGHGINERRVKIEGGSPHVEMFAHYQRLDIALDPFPYNGGLTTCEAMWMGVPVITLPGETFAGRHGLTHMSNAGLTETIARDVDDYVDLAVNLAHDLPRLASLRAQLRPRMASSPLCDGKRFAENFVRQLREVWASPTSRIQR